MTTSQSSPDVHIADPMVAAEAQRVVLSAESQVRHTRDEAERVVGHVACDEADSRILQSPK